MTRASWCIAAHCVAATVLSFVVGIKTQAGQRDRTSSDTKTPVGSRSPALKTQFGDLAIFPSDNQWNQDISKLPVLPKSADYIKSIGLDKPLHPDFGTVWQGALVRYDEVVERGEIRHALRFTCRRTQRGYIAPATHWASSSRDRSLPPMGLRVRHKADYDISGFPKNVQVILTALKKYSMFVADNGGDWFISGAPNAKWNDDELHTIKRIKGSAFEAVDTGPLITE